MGKVILGVTISVDGFAEDTSGSVGPLYPDLALLDQTETMRESIRTTGAVVMAWKEYTMAEDPDWVDGYEYQAPIFVVCDNAPDKRPKETKKITFTFVTDGFASALRQAKHAAGKKDVTIIGSAATTPRCLETGLVDELHLDIIPVLLREGFRPFENIRDLPFRLVRRGSVDLPAGRIHIEFELVPLEPEGEVIHG